MEGSQISNRDGPTRKPQTTIESYTTFRLQGIPSTYERKTVMRLLLKVLHLQDETIVQVKSLALSSFDNNEAVATLSFNQIPPSLLNCHGSTKLETSPTDVQRGAAPLKLELDTHFHGFTVLYCPEATAWKFDLIAISGLGGHAFGSFKSRGETNMWLRDMLPTKFREARVLIYGYDTALEDGESVKNIHDIGKVFCQDLKTHTRQQEITKPLVLLGHSLGGIIIKQAMIEMTKCGEQDRSALNSIAGLLFFGVPNRGMDVGWLTPMVGDGSNRYLLETLAPTSQWLPDQCQEFGKICPKDIRIGTFYETRKSPSTIQCEGGRWKQIGPSILIVGKDSAVQTGIGSSFELPIDKTHSDLVKISSKFDGGYNQILSYLRNISEELQARKCSLFESLNSEPDKYLKDDRSAWGRMTSKGLAIYDQIFRGSANSRGQVQLIDLLEHFPLDTQNLVEKSWRNVARDAAFIHRGMTYAVIYSVHLCHHAHVSLDKLQILPDARGTRQRGALRHFATWVACNCNFNNSQCPCRWNFINDIGMCQNKVNECQANFMLAKRKRFKNYGEHELKALKQRWRCAEGDPVD